MCIDLIGRRRAARDCAANLRVVQPIADTDDHSRSHFENATQHQLPDLRMIVNNVESYVSVQSTGLLAPWPSALLMLQSFSILGTGKARARARARGEGRLFPIFALQDGTFARPGAERASVGSGRGASIRWRGSKPEARESWWRCGGGCRVRRYSPRYSRVNRICTGRAIGAPRRFGSRFGVQRGRGVLDRVSTLCCIDVTLGEGIRSAPCCAPRAMAKWLQPLGEIC